MNHTLGIALASLAVVCVTSAVSTQGVDTQRPRYEASDQIQVFSTISMDYAAANASTGVD